MSTPDDTEHEREKALLRREIESLANDLAHMKRVQDALSWLVMIDGQVVVRARDEMLARAAADGVDGAVVAKVGP